MGSEAALAEGFLSSVSPCVDLLGPEAVCSGKGLERIHGLSPHRIMARCSLHVTFCKFGCKYLE